MCIRHNTLYYILYCINNYSDPTARTAVLYTYDSSHTPPYNALYIKWINGEKLHVMQNYYTITILLAVTKLYTLMGCYKPSVYSPVYIPYQAQIRSKRMGGATCKARRESLKLIKYSYR